MRILEDELILSTGTRLYAHGGVLGLGDDGVACQGWDGGLNDGKLTALERHEVAQEMARRWLAWGNGDT